MYKNKYLEECLEKNQGSRCLLRGYGHTKDRRYDEIVINNLGFISNNPEELEEFKKELIKANISEFILTETSSGLMNDLHALNSVKIRIKEVTKIKYLDNWDDKREYFTEGLKMIVG